MSKLLFRLHLSSPDFHRFANKIYLQRHKYRCCVLESKPRFLSAEQRGCHIHPRQLHILRNYFDRSYSCLFLNNRFPKELFCIENRCYLGYWKVLELVSLKAAAAEATLDAGFEFCPQLSRLGYPLMLRREPAAPAPAPDADAADAAGWGGWSVTAAELAIRRCTNQVTRNNQNNSRSVSRLEPGSNSMGAPTQRSMVRSEP